MSSACEKNITLAIETAVEGGSIALFDGEQLIYAAVGEKDGTESARASGQGESILRAIEEALEKNSLETALIKTIVTSSGPGSFTGARIGATTALGLSKSIGCAVASTSILEAMSVVGSITHQSALPALNDLCSVEIKQIKVLTAIPFGREQFCCQVFVVETSGEVSELNKLNVSRRSELAAVLNTEIYDLAVLHAALYEDCENSASGREIFKNSLNFKPFGIINAGRNLAATLGKSFLSLKSRTTDTDRKISLVYVQS